MTDAVAISVVTGVTTIVVTAINALITIRTKRHVKRLREDVQENRATYDDIYRELMTRHPDDLPPPSIR